MRNLLRWLLLGLALMARAGWAADAVNVLVVESDLDVDYRNGIYVATLSFKVPVVARVVLDVLTDFEHMAAFVPNLKRSRVIDRAGRIYRVEQDGKAVLGAFTIDFHSLRQIEVLPGGRIVSDSLPGSSSRSHSEMKVLDGGAGWTRLDYTLELEPSAWIPSSLGVGFLRHEMAEQFDAMAREMVRRSRETR